MFGKLPPLSAWSSALIALVVGFGGTVALVVHALQVLGASVEQTGSAVTALCLAMAVETLYLSWRTKMPVISAWSTPGAALIAASSGFTVADAVGAFIITAVLLQRKQP